MHKFRIAVKINNNINIGSLNKCLKDPCGDTPSSSILSLFSLLSLYFTLTKRNNAVILAIASIGYALSLVFSTMIPATRGPTSVEPWLINCITELAFCKYSLFTNAGIAE